MAVQAFSVNPGHAEQKEDGRDRRVLHLCDVSSWKIWVLPYFWLNTVKYSLDNCFEAELQYGIHM